MPRIGTSNATQGGIAFSPVRMDQLQASEYTVGGIAVDASGSVGTFVSDLERMLAASVEACQKSPLRDNMLLRVVQFTDTFQDDLDEIVGFTPVMTLQPDQFKGSIKIGSLTPLYKAAFNVVHACKEQGKQLVQSGYNCNGIAYIITDGMDTRRAGFDPQMVAAEIASIAREEALGSFVTILIGVGCGEEGKRDSNEQQVYDGLKAFQKEAGITHFLPVADASAKSLAKLAGFISKSMSSTSQAIRTGGPSQMVAPGASLTI